MLVRQERSLSACYIAIDDPAKADCDQEVAGEVWAVGIGDGGWGAGEV